MVAWPGNYNAGQKESDPPKILKLQRLPMACWDEHVAPNPNQPNIGGLCSLESLVTRAAPTPEVWDLHSWKSSGSWTFADVFRVNQKANCKWAIILKNSTLKSLSALQPGPSWPSRAQGNRLIRCTNFPPQPLEELAPSKDLISLGLASLERNLNCTGAPQDMNTIQLQIFICFVYTNLG